MGTALVMEHANALAQMIVSEKDKLFDERVEALVKLYRRAEFYLKQGFLESIVCEFHRKKVEMIMQAETKGEITEILKLSKPHFDGKKFVYTSPYAVEEEELLLWSLTSLQELLEDIGQMEARIVIEELLENQTREQLLLQEAQGKYPEWNKMSDERLMKALHTLRDEERKLIYQHVFEERTFEEMSRLNGLSEERCKGIYYYAIRKIRKVMGGEN